MNKIKLAFLSNDYPLKTFISKALPVEDLINGKYEVVVEEIKEEVVIITDSLSENSLNEIYDSYAVVTILYSSGILDKNKVEIFEKDIVKVNDKLYTVEITGSAFSLIDLDGNFYEYMCNLCDMGGKVYEIVSNKLLKKITKIVVQNSTHK